MGKSSILDCLSVLQTRCVERESSCTPIIVNSTLTLTISSGYRCKIHHIAAVQIEYNPFSLDIEQNGLLAACRELSVAVVCYAPLGRGFLTGQLKSPDDFPEGDIRRFLPRFSPENFTKNLKIVDAVEQIAKSKGVSTSALALAWLLAQGDDIIPIPGTTKTKNLDTNIQSLSVTLTPEENKQIRDVVEAAGVSGGRYHAA